MTTDPNRHEEVDPENRTLPPYEGRRESADVEGKEKSAKEGARTGGATGPVEDEDMKATEPGRTERGATGPVEDEDMKATEPGRTERGATGSPADERPADRSRQTADDDQGTGPAHTKGTPRAEDQS